VSARFCGLAPHPPFPIAHYRRSRFPIADLRFSAALLVALILAITTIAAFPTTVSAQSAPTLTDNGVTNTFPNGMVFAVTTESDSPVEEIKLRYKILPDGTAAIGRPEFDPATSVTTSIELGGADLYLPPGTVIEYFWEATDADGDQSRTETQSFFYDDVRFQWTPIEADGVTIYYYSGSDDDAQAMLQAASETIQSMSDLLGADIGFPIKVWIYDNVNDMRPALMRRSETYEESVITAGVRVSTDTVLVLGNASFDTLKHELTHIVTAAAGEGPLGKMPAWLDEGTAVFGQGDPGGFEDAVNQAIDRGNVFTLRQITSSPGDPSAVGLFYGQSWSVVKYLHDTYGPEKFAQIFAEIKGGKRIDAALEAVYGFDQDGLDNEWRVAHGLEPRDPPQPTEDASQATTAPSDSQEDPRSEDGGGTSPIVIVGLALGLIILAGAVGLTGWAVSRRL
jgi:Peptidase MA superfamily